MKRKIKAKSPKKKRNKKDVPKTPESCYSDASEEDTGVCEECGGVYADDSKIVREKWMGCDNCHRWYY